MNTRKDTVIRVSRSYEPTYRGSYNMLPLKNLSCLLLRVILPSSVAAYEMRTSGADPRYVNQTKWSALVAVVMLVSSDHLMSVCSILQPQPCSRFDIRSVSRCPCTIVWYFFLCICFAFSFEGTGGSIVFSYKRLSVMLYLFILLLSQFSLISSITSPSTS
ncbi:hypothetical protein BDZ89DRAFT_548530 [Hymenopellis radicata]|nr:hypothetical protein BDZ89DRAFT_548530 [Hymenopellis radicata]